MKIFLASSHNTVLVLESDVLVSSPQWVDMLKNVVDELKTLEGWRKSITFCGNGCGLTPSAESARGKYLYEMNASKCCDSMIWQRESIEEITKHMFPIVAPIDVWLTHCWFRPHSDVHKAYWIQPTIFEQGSQNGKYASNVQ